MARPDLVLFDEPLSNLDATPARPPPHRDPRAARALGFTAVYVTHDQIEAMALGDRIAIMRSGTIEQLGTPEEIFEQPATEYVADFIGMANRLTFERRDGGWTYEGRPSRAPRLARPPRRPRCLRARSGGRPSRAARSGSCMPDTIGLPATVAGSEFGGRHLDVVVNARLDARAEQDPRGRAGQLGAEHSSPGQPVVALLRTHVSGLLRRLGCAAQLGRPAAVATS